MDIPFRKRFNFTPRGVLGVLFLGTMLILGCTQPGSALGPLSGRVTNNGQAVTSARIHFENAELGAGTVIDLDAEGKFSVATADGPGLPPGKYRVAIKPQRISAAMSPTGDLPLEALAGSSAAKDPPPCRQHTTSKRARAVPQSCKGRVWARSEVRPTESSPPL